MDPYTQFMDEDSKVAETGSDDGKIWNDKFEEYFIMLMEEEKKKGNRKTTTFYPKGWKAIEEGMKRLTCRDYTRQQLRNKFYQLRDRYKSYKEFLSNIGSSWDSKSGQVTLTEAQWEKMYKEVKNAKRLQRKGCKHYDLLSDLFDGTSASNALDSLSTDSEDDFLEAMCNVMNVFGDYWRRAEAIEKVVESDVYGRTSGGVEVDEDMTRVEAFVAALDSMEGLDSDRYFKALTMFCDDALWRKMFLGLDDERKRGLIWSL
ncbi:L10-interacting MYB domain-containing protein-like [Cornus florida]|uniref:L10-interacting MYB domain-containing protein-like n=1 Tax=Cornus florida TaxID=4283 RepID=UPI002896CF7D|nr:L10-interacting MYB domain-containing protein-like [Cornus florida]